MTSVKEEHHDKYENGLFIFRRDLRIQDNIGLNYALSQCKNVYTIFIFTPEQVTSKNKFKSDNSIQFMIESLDELSENIKQHGGVLELFYGENNKIITKYIKLKNIDAIFFNRDITPYAKKRDKSIIDMCEKIKNKIPVFTSQDYYLFEPGSILAGNGKDAHVYTKFTPYYNEALRKEKEIDQPFIRTNYNFSSNKNEKGGMQRQGQGQISITDAYLRFPSELNKNILVNGGRIAGLEKLKNIASPIIKNYKNTHNMLSMNTTQLSAYLKFGCISIREAYYTMSEKYSKTCDLIRQLIWREFYANILYAYPYVLTGAMKPKYNKVKWVNNREYLRAWENGRTGFPIIDAAMTELNTTGYMHNRARLIVASFLIKTLLINWQDGEKYFATKLTDYDPASNNGNWQWVASTGADSQPYFRIFNPFTQSENYDSDAEYIKKWLPELKDIPPKHLHQWDKYWREYLENRKDGVKINYPSPIVNYEEQRAKALKMYSTALV
jgi:deoxyribodipyrimidine photo-lyase